MAHNSFFSTVSRLLNQVIYCDTLTVYYKWNILLNLIIDCDSFFHVNLKKLLMMCAAIGKYLTCNLALSIAIHALFLFLDREC